MTEKEGSTVVPGEATGTNGARAKGGRSTGTRKTTQKTAQEKTNDEVTTQVLAKLETVHQELGRERLLREQAEADAAHKLEMAHERIQELEDKLAEQRELESALLSARQRVADLEVQLALRHEGRRERRHHSKRDKRPRRWWMLGR